MKAIAWEEALGKPAREFSFDDGFKLDSDCSIIEEDNWSPIANGGAKVTLENRVSPLKPQLTQKFPSTKDTNLLGGVFPATST